MIQRFPLIKPSFVGKSRLIHSSSRVTQLTGRPIRWLEGHNRISFAIALIIAILIFYISSLTFLPGSPAGSSGKAEAYHISAFFMLELFLLISIIKGREGEGIFLIIIIIGILYGISDEIHQSFVPGRAVSLKDVFLDSIGILLAFLIYFISLQYRKGKQFKKMSFQEKE